jgi:hypothetical protein
MRTLGKPDDTPSAVFRLCISKVKNRDLKRRLTSVEPIVVKTSEDYNIAAESAALHTFPRSADVGLITRDEMIDVYVGRMVPETQPGRVVYDRLMNAPALGRCPLCGVGLVKTLDHHLPKTQYTALSVTPTNLIPSCYWCQFSKRQGYPTTAGEQTLHPYYDDFTNDRWLRAEVIETRPASFVFSVDPPNGWTEETANRLRSHMKTFCLYDLYSSNAGSELRNMHYRLNELFIDGGPGSVRTHLLEEAATRRAANLNSWETATYNAAAASDWFCDRGFEL